jgi:hypothetical protein
MEVNSSCYGACREKLLVPGRACNIVNHANFPFYFISGLLARMPPMDSLRFDTFSLRLGRCLQCSSNALPPALVVIALLIAHKRKHSMTDQLPARAIRTVLLSTRLPGCFVCLQYLFHPV